MANRRGIRSLSLATAAGAVVSLTLGAWSGSYIYYGALAGFLAAASLIGFLETGIMATSSRSRLRLLFRRRHGGHRCGDAFALLGDIHDAMGEIAVTRDLDGRILHANETFRRVTACLSPCGMRCEDLGVLLNPGAPASGCDVEIATPFDRRVFAWRDAIVRDPASGKQILQSVARDVTELRLEEQRREAARKTAEAQNSAKSRLLATVSHEIRTPLNGILGMAHLLEGTALQASQRNYLDGIRQSGLTLEHLVNDLLDFSTLEVGRLTVHPVAVAPRQLIEGVVEMLAHRAHEKGIELAMTVNPAVPPMMEFDAARLRQVLFNVIGNAVKFTAAGGVLVTVEWVLGDLRVSVADSGPGMSADERQTIFEEFAQAGTERQKSGGTGLGLAISARILRQFGGSLTVDSTIGQGSTFTIRLPATAVATTAPVADAAQVLAHSCVLLLAPDGPAARAITATIRMLAGRCQLAVSRDEAAMHIDRMRFSGDRFTDIIVDHRLAAAFDQDLAQRIDRAGHAPRKIFLVNPEARADLAAGPFDAWLIRPLREQTLIDVLLGRLRGIERRGLQHGRSQSRQRPAGVASQNLLVLIADDDPVNRLLSRSVLQRAGHEVRSADDVTGLRAEIAASSRRRPDVIVTDLNMPGGDGMEMLAQIRSLEQLEGFAPVPIIVLTGDGRETVRRQALESGADRILEKPVSPALLLRTVDELTSRNFRVSKSQ